jgi:hypothetical protein
MERTWNCVCVASWAARRPTGTLTPHAGTAHTYAALAPTAFCGDIGYSSTPGTRSSPA